MRDSFFGEHVVWAGRPRTVVVPGLYRAFSACFGVVAAVAVSFALVAGTALGRPVGGLVALAAWSAALSVGTRWLLVRWRSGVEYVVTDSHVIAKRGLFKRTIERGAITYARVTWYPGTPGTGDLELVRAVPTGALRRRLSLVLCGVAAPDRLWAIIRDVAPSMGAGDPHRPLAQRLDEGERVLWAARPKRTWRRWVPSGMHEAVALAVGIGTAISLGLFVRRALPATRLVLEADLPVASVAFVALVAGTTLTALLLAGMAAGIVWAGLVRPARLLGATRYLVTDRRVLIQRGTEELYLDRDRIVDVIDAPLRGGLHDLFLVLDGPRARGLEAGGAFGRAERGDDALVPVLHAVQDVESESVSKILRAAPAGPPFRDAA